MTIKTPNQEIVTNFLIEVTQAITFDVLETAYKIVVGDFNKLATKENGELLKQFLERYKTLTNQAEAILKEETNGNEPTAEQIAIFGEMIILRDFCKMRLDRSK